MNKPIEYTITDFFGGALAGTGTAGGAGGVGLALVTSNINFL